MRRRSTLLASAVLALGFHVPVLPAQQPAVLPPPEAVRAPEASRAFLQPPVVVDADIMPIDLPTALRLVNTSSPLQAMARARVEQAVQRERQAQVLWLPTLQAGGNYLRHDGLIQNSVGLVFNSNRWSTFGGGAALAHIDTADALFMPLVTRQLTAAQGAQLQTVIQQTQLDVALTYLDLLDVRGRLAINAETIANAELMLKNAKAAQQAGVGKTAADTPRAQTEVEARRVERIDLEVRAAEVSARLAQLLLLPPTVDLRPVDPAVVPVALVAPGMDLDELVAVGLRYRPELARSRSIVEATLLRWRQAKMRPLLPKLEVGYSGGNFSGGRGTDTLASGGRGDGAAAAFWELQGMGLGNLAQAREQRAVHDEAVFHVQEIQAEVAAEVIAAARACLLRERAFHSAQEAVRQAMESWRRLRAANFGLATPDRRYDPLEPLIAEQQLASARAQYLAEVIAFNKAQFRLYTAMGQPPECALPQAQALAVSVPVLP